MADTNSTTQHRTGTSRQQTQQPQPGAIETGIGPLNKRDLASAAAGAKQMHAGWQKLTGILAKAGVEASAYTANPA